MRFLKILWGFFKILKDSSSIEGFWEVFRRFLGEFEGFFDILGDS